MLAPILLIRGYVPGMRERKFGRIVNITSAMVKSPRPHMALSTSARTGLTAFSKSLSLDVAVDIGSTCWVLVPLAVLVAIRIQYY